MPKSSRQKLKLLYLMQFLLQNSDDQHPCTIADMIDYLANLDISAERKSLYDDIESLRLFGLDIVQSRSKTTGYFIGNRDFQLAELKLLVDSVQSSKFITENKTLSLIKKIEGLASSYDAQLLQRQVYVRNRVKSMNESVLYNVDEISNAITLNKKISFKYFEYTVTKERHFRHDGGLYVVSPFALMWDNENYYMLAWDAAAARMKHYRVDKMTAISSMTDDREGMEAFEKLDMAQYSKRVFGMFSGDVQRVKLRFSNSLVSVVIDRFSPDIMIIPDGPEHFTVDLEVAVSPQFFAWVCGFEDKVQILGPSDVVDQMKEYVKNIAKLYK